MRKLFLDDMRKPPDWTWDVVRNYQQFVRFITLNGVPDIISFDHDLGQEHYEVIDWDGKLHDHLNGQIPYDKFTEKTGYDCAKWLVEGNLLPKSYLVHSLNPVGAQNIKFVMDGAYKRAANSTG